MIRVKKEELEETQKPVLSSPAQSTVSNPTAPESQQDSLNLFLQKPGSLSNLSKLLEEAKMTQDSDTDSHNSLNSHSAKVPTTASYPSYPFSQRGLSHSPSPATYQQVISTDKTDTSVPSSLSATQLKGSPWITCSPQYGLHDDQLSKILKEKSSQWFSLLPRSPCDQSTVTSGSWPPASSSPQTINAKSLSSPSPDSLATASYNAHAGINNLPPSVLQVAQPQLFQIMLSIFKTLICIVTVNSCYVSSHVGNT